MIVLSYNKLTCIRIVLHINHDPISRGYVGCFLAFTILLLSPDWVHSWFSRAISLDSGLFFTALFRDTDWLTLYLMLQCGDILLDALSRLLQCRK